MWSPNTACTVCRDKSCFRHAWMVGRDTLCSRANCEMFSPPAAAIAISSFLEGEVENFARRFSVWSIILYSF